MLPDRLPCHPQPIPGESLSSWLMRTAHDNVERLSYVTTRLTGDANFWTNDVDRRLTPDLCSRLTQGTGVTQGKLERLVLSQYAGTLFPVLTQQGSPPWLLKMAKRGYRLTRPGSMYCPACLAEDAVPYLRLQWRLSFLTTCSRHGTLLRENCPHCSAAFAPHLNDLGPGKDWRFQEASPFIWCPACEGKLTVRIVGAEADQVAFQQRLLVASSTNVMPWPNLLEVPAEEGFSVLHQLLAVLMLPEVRGRLPLPDVMRIPARRNRSFEDFDLMDRHVLLVRLAYLLEDWPHRLLEVTRAAKVTRRPLVYNMGQIPGWYDLVADQLSQANGRRAYKVVPLVPHLSLAEIAERRDTAATEAERKRWNVVWHYAQQPEKWPIARKLGVDWQFVHNTVTKYNAGGPEALGDIRRGRPLQKKRLLDEAQEQELRNLLDMSPVRLSNTQLADWFEERIGKRPDATTLWIYRRGVGHSQAGRRAEQKK